VSGPFGAGRGLAACSWGQERVFPDRALWNRYWDDSSWHPWESLGGSLDPSSVPAAASWGPDGLSVITRGTDGATWHRWWDGSRWVAWERLPA
jgi:hypothetical protein